MPAATREHILILTALQLECDAVLGQVDTQSRSVSGGQRFRGEIGGFDVTVTCLQGMGNVASAAFTSSLITELRPNAVLLVGIAGGAKRPTSELATAGNHFLGDVLIADQVIDYEFGKQTKDGFEHRFRAYPASHRWLSLAKALKPKQWVAEVPGQRPDGSTVRIAPCAHVGGFASGEKVVKDNHTVQDLKKVWSQLIGIEMEGLGVALACHQSSPPTEFLVVKGICDWADPDKNDSWQPYAAATATAFVKALLLSATPQVGMSPGGVTAPKLAGDIKLSFIRRIAGDWKDLADALEIPSYDTARFVRGEEGRGIWEWLENRRRLQELSDALARIGRKDLSEDCKNPR